MQNTYSFHAFQNLQISDPNFSTVLNCLAELKTEYGTEDLNVHKNSTILEDERQNLLQLLGHEYLAIVLARHDETETYVGYGTLEKHPKDTNTISIEFGGAYVKPDHRKRGVFGNIADKIEEVAREMGYQEIKAFPAIDGRSRRVLERKGYIVISEHTRGEVDLVKYVSPGMGTEGKSIPNKERF